MSRVEHAKNGKMWFPMATFFRSTTSKGLRRGEYAPLRQLKGAVRRPSPHPQTQGVGPKSNVWCPTFGCLNAGFLEPARALRKSSPLLAGGSAQASYSRDRFSRAAGISQRLGDYMG